MAEPTAVQVKEKIDLTDTEKDIFYTLLETIRKFERNTVPRVAGGWVRDKLLGKECHDIDIALSNMSGSEFVGKVTKYLPDAGLKPPAGIGYIPKKPEKSKHLETARMKLFGLWIDFVNLRCEEYSENSRIPTMKFGTAKEDAYRRDLTINSLFYNFNTNSVEDLTGRGIEDLKSGKIVTPLPPKATFLDDPLRVLRAIRFALAAKISRERIGIEIDLMISGNQPVKAMTYICDLTLFWIVFNLPPKCEPVVSEGCDRYVYNLLSLSFTLLHYYSVILTNALVRNYSASRFSSKLVSYMLQIPIINYIFRDSLKRKARDAETVINIHRALKKFLSLIPSLVSTDSKVSEIDSDGELVDISAPSKLRVLTGFLLKEIKDFWRVAMLISTLLYPIDVDCTQDILSKNFQLDKRRDLFTEVENANIKLCLEKVWDVKPLVNGKEIMNVLQLKSGGPLVQEWQRKLLAWQLAHPFGSAEECLDWIKKTTSIFPSKH
ncbi:hypothetical protein Ddye_021052 [Dipteronia dyeriana]|uniref:Poly A polymerase head domain-containing protein n=1 Tax=Dipteronia dyeriana TaxID=168575 RepID=A0AAD9WXC8_9ROSI|nr:hypothetical protein Ddye_021052 [Dipteronia dyeriana]